jgi:UDP-N-acetyl-2-amino-2-deoxyglucuronate dehydrogenase
MPLLQPIQPDKPHADRANNLRWALTGVAGYVAPRHLKAIRDTGNTLVAGYDPNDSVGILDSYFPEANFFTEFERFDRHLEKLKRSGRPAHFVSVCSPNYLHDAHVRYGLRYGADVICEKPLVLNPWNLDALQELEQESGRQVWNLLQLRHHPQVIALKKTVEQSDPGKIFDLDLTYITPRGRWYYASWKGDESKSGGITTNIGIHLFDMLLWVFGPVQEVQVHVRTHGRAAGYLQLERARVRWFLSIEGETLPEAIRKTDIRSYRSILLEGREWEFSEGFADLHTRCYESILENRGWHVEDARPGVELAYRLRNMAPEVVEETAHPLTGLPLMPHPFAK